VRIRSSAIPALLICLVTVAFAQPDNLYVSITLQVSEHSKDSHATRTSFVITGKKVIYDETYFGYRSSNREPVHKEYVFTDPEIANLKRLIQERGLLRPRSFTVPPQEAPYTRYELTEEIKWKGGGSLIKVLGSLQELAQADVNSRRTYEDANALLEYVRSTLKAKGEAQ
jgi:hypothetical protein